MFKNAKSAEKFATDFLERYTAVGFGALSKREVDLLLIELFHEHLLGFKEQTDFDAALTLKTTKRKIRGLRDEVSFRDAHDKSKLKARLKEELKKAEILPGDHGKVMLQIDDAVLRGFAEKIVRSEYGIVDSSYNNTIMQLSGEKFLLLAYSVLSDTDREIAEKTVKEIQSKIGMQTKEEKTPFKLFMDAFASGAGNQSGKLFVSGALALITGGASIVLEGSEVVTSSAQGITKALKKVSSYFVELAKKRNGDL